MYDFNKLDEIIKEHNYNGTILISKNKDIVFCKGYGFNNKSEGIVNVPDYPLRIASITKTFTAVAILKLYEQNKLDLQDKLKIYLPEFSHDITVHDLLSNSSGVANFDINMDFSEVSNSKNVLQAIINVFKENPLEFPTGSRFGYSISGYLLLQHVIEKVTELTYYEYLSKEVFSVLDMSNTYFETPYVRIPNMAIPYTLVDGKLEDAIKFDMRIAGAGGALVSTVGDIHKLNNGLLDFKVLSKESVDKVFGNQIKITDNDFYGYGMILHTSTQYGKKRRKYYHSGGGFGVRAFNTFYPDDNVQVVLLSNLDDRDIFNNTREAVDDFLLK